MNLRFEWDAHKALTNQVKHGLSFEEAMSVFTDPLARILDDPDHSVAESREIIVGLSQKQRLLARVIHEHFCCNRRSAAATSLRPAGSPLGPSTYCTSTHRVLTAPRAGLATRLSDFATNRHE